MGALFTLPCNVSSVVVPSPAQLSTKKWKEYIARKPKVITGRLKKMNTGVFCMVISICVYMYI